MSRACACAVIGERERFGPNLAAELAAAEAKTADNTGLTLVMALSYGGRADIVERGAPGDRGRARRRTTLTEQSFAELLATDGIPDPDLLIRTSGEKRISNFLLWQTAYAELLFTEVLWPDFGAGGFCPGGRRNLPRGSGVLAHALSDVAQARPSGALVGFLGPARPRR